jgi:hypothetical protein
MLNSLAAAIKRGVFTSAIKPLLAFFFSKEGNFYV